MKRAAIVASHDTIECVLHNRTSAPDRRQMNTFGSISYLQSIGSATSSAVTMNEAMDGILLDILQWAMGAADKEPDPQCRAFLSQIILLSIDNAEQTQS